MKHRLMVIASGAALVAGLVAANTADAHGRSARAILANAEGARIGSVEFRTDDGHTEVTFTLTISHPLPLPGFIRSRTIKGLVANNTGGLKQYLAP